MVAVRRRRILQTGSLLLITYFLGQPGHAAPLGGADLVAALRRGGFVLVLRHANSPPKPPQKHAADPANSRNERQLDELGRSSAEAMGVAFRRLRIPVGQVWCSPAFRARETVRLASFGAPVIVPELDETRLGMQGGTDAARAAWLRAKLAEAPEAGTNTVIVTHLPNIAGVFGPRAAGLAAGETLIFQPGGNPDAEPVARVKIEAWKALATLP